jgi:hypothetical protein
MKKIKNLSLVYFGNSFVTALGVVLIWRGIWHLLDILDVLVFASNPLWTALGGIAIGLLILFLPDHDLKELRH